MKTLNVAAIISASVLFSGTAFAKDAFEKDTHNHHFMAKRPYQAVVANNSQQKDPQWEGATFIANEVNAEDGNLNAQKALRLNMLSKRPY